MDEQKIRQIIRQEIQANSGASRFALNPIQRHTHNGIDSPTVLQPIVSYVGLIASNGGYTLIPDGWSSVKLDTGSYRVSHNLPSTAIIGISVTPVDAGTQVGAVAFGNEGNFTVATFSTGSGGGAFSNGFYFTVTVVNNTSLSLPTYSKFIRNA